VQIETWLLLIQAGQQPNFPPDEASITEFYYIMKEDTVTLTLYPQTQPQGIGGRFTTQSATEDMRNRTTGCTGKPHPACAYCSKDFGRIQELERHVKDAHMPPHQCPFCPFMWTRPAKLKDHLMADHAKIFSPEIQEKIKPLRGQAFIKFLGEYVRRLDVGATSQPMVQAPQIPGPFRF